MDNLEDQNQEAPKKRGPKPKVSRPPQRKEAGAPSRVSYKDRRKLSVSGLDTEKFKYRWVNTDEGKWVNTDEGKYSGRLEQVKKMGYIEATEGELSDMQGVEASSIGSNFSRPVGNGTRAVLMKQPIEFYEEDKAEKQAEVDQTERGMIDDELIRNSEGLYGEGLKVSDARGSRLDVNVRR